ncbi:hypothetical protein AX15_000991 [Amanita polypyramis BW_CC]|nr:hypothetical protein AX15_000991 [Amanita polypyramis BW_CC]
MSRGTTSIPKLRYIVQVPLTSYVSQCFDSTEILLQIAKTNADHFTPQGVVTIAEPSVGDTHDNGTFSHPQPSSVNCFSGPGHWRRKLSTWQLVLVLTPYTILVTTCVVAAIAAALIFYAPVRHGNYLEHDKAVGRLPALGFNTWNAYHCDINEHVVLTSANLMKSLGLADAGYNYVNIDDCYSEKERDGSGNIVANKARFPSGMKNLTDQIHSLGFKAGIYSDSGWYTCALYPGSFQNEARDAKLFQDWGFDYLKYDNCAAPFDEIIKEGMVGKFKRMADAIADLSITSGKSPLFYSLCQWGREEPWLWARQFGQSWRTTDDIEPTWRSVASIINQFVAISPLMRDKMIKPSMAGIRSILGQATSMATTISIWQLEIGNGDLNHEESKTHFTAWALMKSPLLIGTDLSKVSRESLEILKNSELIAINQDPVVGTAVTPFRWGINPDWTFNSTHPAQYWSGQTQNGTVFMLINVLDHPVDMSFNLTESPWIRAGRQYHVRDLWTHTDNGTAVRTIDVHRVPAHGVVALLVRDAGDEPAGTEPPCARLEWCVDQNGTRID